MEKSEGLEFFEPLNDDARMVKFTTKVFLFIGGFLSGCVAVVVAFIGIGITADRAVQVTDTTQPSEVVDDEWSNTFSSNSVADEAREFLASRLDTLNLISDGIPKVAWDVDDVSLSKKWRWCETAYRENGSGIRNCFSVDPKNLDTRVKYEPATFWNQRVHVMVLECQIRACVSVQSFSGTGSDGSEAELLGER